MPKTNDERFDDTIAYVRNLDDALATDIESRTPFHNVVGSALSLEAQNWTERFKNVLTNERQRQAVRALVLCRAVYHQVPYATAAQNGTHFSFGSPEDVIRYFRDKDQQTLDDAIRCYVQIGGNVQSLVRAAQARQNPAGGIQWDTITRQPNAAFGEQTCFNGVALWLFQSGYVSLRWLIKCKMDMTPQLVNTWLGNGVQIQPAALANMPRGHIFNFHLQNRSDVCHWGISIGAGRGVAVNTKAAALGTAQDAANVEVNFSGAGSSAYGEFALMESYTVCTHSYERSNRQSPLANVVIRQIDPATEPSYY
jgi:hypothetical protein